jgi:hypothetical protein
LVRVDTDIIEYIACIVSETTQATKPLTADKAGKTGQST